MKELADAERVRFSSYSAINDTLIFLLHSCKESLWIVSNSAQFRHFSDIR